ncbi:hypothetical protein A374_15534 [Fictibacillus macauensis ZFHKF-1]|uniref:Sporulation protein YtxC n=1 Tax=Fictibacillus macauensis ZFHKF-1 TaxID=1196324 RepID=I8AG94_9BACL|nr:sporulation protein YtxC [Fictibacillus macauensis]EIT84429.1 hypothetical protein A374_15534 [Fictibacillus macauensis ZFHKF-1]
MAELILANAHEMRTLQEELNQIARTIHMEPSFMESGTCNLRIIAGKETEAAQVLTLYTRKRIEEDRLLHYIENHFYFYDAAEQQAIAAIAKEFIDQERLDVPALCELPTCEEHIINAWQQMLQERRAFTFASFVKFRLRSYNELLLAYVECAIDEYKLELEYQSFIDQLRKCMFKEPPLTNVIHVVWDGTFTLYDDQGQPYSSAVLEAMYERALGVTQELDLDSTVLGPIIGLAPEALYVYGDEEHHGMIYTLQNVFQERFVKRPLAAFFHKKESEWTMQQDFHKGNS